MAGSAGCEVLLNYHPCITSAHSQFGSRDSDIIGTSRSGPIIIFPLKEGHFAFAIQNTVTLIVRIILPLFMSIDI